MGGKDALGGLLSSLGGKDGGLGIDPAMLLKAGRVLSQANGKPDERCTLLSALKPYLRQERQTRVDEAIRILHILRLLELYRNE